MKNLKTRHDAKQERAFGIEVLHDIREIALRKLDAKVGCANLHKFCMKELKYSSGSAWRRVKAMEALQDLPALEEKIATGELTLANVSQVQSFCAQKDKTVEEKQEIFKKVDGLSKRETEKVLAELAPLPALPDHVRELDGKKTELRITLDTETIQALDKLRDLIAHSQPGATYSDVVARLAKIGLQKLDPAAEKRTRKVIFPPVGKPEAGTSAAKNQVTQAQVEKSAIIVKAASANNAAPIPPKRTHIPAATQREVWLRDGGRCGYTSQETGKVCGERAFVQIDHAVPIAHGGGNEPSNLRLRCQTHNIQHAIEALGLAKMAPYLQRG